jgi:hypothetical protein
LFHTAEGEDIELASDYLGNCVYESLRSFADHRECARQNRDYEARGDAGRCGSYFSGMISTVISEARQEYAKLAERIADIHLRSV